ncbi:MAG: tetratricopeptide repeat protein, partial [Lachnospiraceae bacterium]|nr:tetratricopeptide repeat protein [Candidatus Equihabitans merdae]
MDKAEYKVKLNDINELAQAGDFKAAADKADTIDWRHVKSPRTLAMISEIYEANKRYEDALRLMKSAYKRSNGSKSVVYRLAELSLKTGDVSAARGYADEFQSLAGSNDASKYVLQYKVKRAEGRPLSEQIAVLETLKEQEYTERWAYELARLYHKNGQDDKCIDECDDLILWFTDGRYVIKTMELKMDIRPLTAAQKRKYDSLTGAAPEFVAPAATVAAPDFSDIAVAKEEPAPVIEAAPEPEADPLYTTSTGSPEMRQAFSEGNRENVQNQLADSIRAVLSGVKSEPTILDDSGIDFYGAATYANEEIPVVGVMSLEKEAEDGGLLEAEPAAADVEDEQMSFDDLATEDELDLKGLFEETGSILANALAEEDFAIHTIAGEEDMAEAKEEEAVSEEPAVEAVVEEAPAEVVEEVAVAEPAVAEVVEEAAAVEPAVVEDTDAVAEVEAAPEVSVSAEDVTEADEEDSAQVSFNFAEMLARSVAAAQERIVVQEEAPVEEVVAEEAVAEEAAAPAEEADDEIFIDMSAVEAIEKAAGITPAPASQSIVMPTDEELAAEADEQPVSLGLTREFNFEAELQKALSEGHDVQNATKTVTDRARAEAAQAQEAQAPTFDTQEMEIPAELLADPSEIAQNEMGNLVDISGVADEYGVNEASRSIIENIMEEPEKIKVLPVEPRRLDETEQKTFSYFAKIPGIAEQVTQAIADVHNNAGDKTSRSGNVVVVGRQGSGKTRLADAMIIAICRDLNIKAAKIAHIIADDLNKK